MKTAPQQRVGVPAKQRSMLAAHPTPPSLVTMLCALTLVTPSAFAAPDAATTSDTTSLPAPNYSTFAHQLPATLADDPYVVIRDGARWRYWDQGPLPGDVVATGEWRNVTFPTDGWQRGPGMLAYGDSSARTHLSSTFRPTPESHREVQRTVYFRRHFKLDPDTAAALRAGTHRLWLRMLVDDGVIVFINNAEQFRFNLPKDPRGETHMVEFERKPPEIYGRPFDAEYNVVTDIIHNATSPGTNVMAVEVHNADHVNRDLKYVGDAAAGEDDVPCPRVPPVNDSEPINIVRGPYLVATNPFGFSVRWRSSEVLVGWVRVAPAPDGYLPHATEYDWLPATFTSVRCPGMEQEAVVEGLMPSTDYVYQVMWGTREYNETDQLAATYGGREPQLVRTAPAYDSPTTLRMWALGDMGTGQHEQSLVRNVAEARMKEEGTAPAMFLALGDNAYGSGTDWQYQSYFFDKYNQTLRHATLWSAFGNHDRYKSSALTQSGPYFTAFNMPKHGQAGGGRSGNSAYYSFDYGDIHFVVLDSSQSQYGPMLTWLRKDLLAVNSPLLAYFNATGELQPHVPARHRRPRSRNPKWLIAIVHAAPYSKGSEDSDLTRPQMYVQKGIMPLLDGAGVDLVLSGHSHSYERSLLIRGHYGNTSTWDPEHMLVDGGLGQLQEDGKVDERYRKPLGLSPGRGFVAAVIGSSGKIQRKNNLDHPVHRAFDGVGAGDSKRGLLECGSMIIDVDSVQNTLHARFINQDGAIRDEFWIVKGAKASS